MNIIARTLIAIAKRTPYFDLHHADGSLYMGRYWLMPLFLLRMVAEPGYKPHLKALAWLPASMRLHHIATRDIDRDKHDHPADFISIVLCGGYCEARPRSVEPCFTSWLEPDGKGGYTEVFGEYQTVTERRPGSIAFRRATDRHRIVDVKPNTWTLVIWFKKRQWWGFYTVRGKVHWQAYESAHNIKPE